MPSEPTKITPTSLNDYLEIMSKSVFQSGMSWKVIENKWQTTREAFHDFDVHRVADFHEGEIEALTQDTRVVRNARKINAIVGNAQRMIELDKEYGTFKKYLQAHGDFAATLKAIKKDFKFMGPSGTYIFLYVVGEQVPTHEEYEAVYSKKKK
ncbi:MAG: DNA-3-methyladenine glycosylase I [Chloroflexota bacterium]